MCLNLSKNENHFQVFSAGTISGGFLPRRSPGTSCENEPQDGMLRNVRPPAASPRPPSSSIRPSFPIRFFLPHPPSFPSLFPPHRSARCLTFQRRCPVPRTARSNVDALSPAAELSAPALRLTRPSFSSRLLSLPAARSPPSTAAPSRTSPSRRAASPAFLLCTRAPSPSAPARSRQENHHGPHPRPPRPRDEPRNFHPDSRPRKPRAPGKGTCPDRRFCIL